MTLPLRLPRPVVHGCSTAQSGYITRLLEETEVFLGSACNGAGVRRPGIETPADLSGPEASKVLDYLLEYRAASRDEYDPWA